MGREVVRQLRVSGHRVHLLARHPDSGLARELAAQFGAHIRPGDVLRENSLRDAFAGIDGVIHLVGVISEVGGQTFENVHLHGTQHVLFAASDAGVRRYIHMSALGTRANAVARYHQTKWAAEEIVRRSGLGWTIFRPSIIYGPGDGFVNLFARFARVSPIVPAIGSGENKFQPVGVKVVAAAFIKALTEDRAVGATYDLCGPETFTLNEILDVIFDVLKRRRSTIHLPLGLAETQAAFLEKIYPALLHKAPPLNRDQILMLQEDNMGNAEPANIMFDLRHEPFREGIARYL